MRVLEGGNFGARRVYNGKTQSFHAGLDLAAPEGTAVAAAGDGRVVLAGDLYFAGGTVLLDHGGGPLHAVLAPVARRREGGGRRREGHAPRRSSAHTGRVTGPHLHWGAKLHGARVNPEELLALPAWPLPGTDATR